MRRTVDNSRIVAFRISRFEYMGLLFIGNSDISKFFVGTKYIIRVESVTI